MRTGVILILAAAALAAVGPPNPDAVTTEIDSPILIPVLANDPSGTLLLGVNLNYAGSAEGEETPITYGRAIMRGNEIYYVPRDGFEGTDTFTYTTNGGTTTVTMTIVDDLSTGGGGGGGVVNTIPVELVNQTSFAIRFLVLSNNRTFYRDCTPSNNPDDPEGNIDVSGMTTEPMATEELCVQVQETNDDNTLIFQAMQSGSSGTPFITTPFIINGVNPQQVSLVRVTVTPVVDTNGAVVGLDIDAVAVP